MAKKKIMLFIVEGPTDETALSTVLNRIFSSESVKFQVVHGDVLTQNRSSSFGGTPTNPVTFARSFTWLTPTACLFLMMPLSWRTPRGGAIPFTPTPRS